MLIALEYKIALKLFFKILLRKKQIENVNSNVMVRNYLKSLTKLITNMQLKHEI